MLIYLPPGNSSQFSFSSWTPTARNFTLCLLEPAFFCFSSWMPAEPPLSHCCGRSWSTCEEFGIASSPAFSQRSWYCKAVIVTVPAWSGYWPTHWHLALGRKIDIGRCWAQSPTPFVPDTHSKLSVCLLNSPLKCDNEKHGCLFWVISLFCLFMVISVSWSRKG